MIFDIAYALIMGLIIWLAWGVMFPLFVRLARFFGYRGLDVFLERWKE